MHTVKLNISRQLINKQHVLYTCTVYVDNFTRIIFRFINVHVTLISRIIHVYGIHVYSGKDLDAFNFAKTCHREVKVTLKLSTYTVCNMYEHNNIDCS